MNKSFFTDADVRNDASRYKCQLVSDAHLFKSMHRIVSFYADAPMRIGESYHPYSTHIPNVLNAPSLPKKRVKLAA